MSLRSFETLIKNGVRLTNLLLVIQAVVVKHFGAAEVFVNLAIVQLAIVTEPLSNCCGVVGTQVASVSRSLTVCSCASTAITSPLYRVT